jgi:hypothetical protein
MIASVGIIRVAVPADPTKPAIWLTEPSHRGPVMFALQLVPFSGIAFLWFIGVLRNRLGALEDRFFATVFLGSALLFVASLYASAAAAAAFLETIAGGNIQQLNTDIYYFARHVSYVFLNVFGIKMAGVFIFSTCAIALRTAIFPRWVALSGFACGAALLVVITHWLWIAILFPLWILLVSAQILVANR